MTDKPTPPIVIGHNRQAFQIEDTPPEFIEAIEADLKDIPSARTLLRNIAIKMYREDGLTEEEAEAKADELMNGECVSTLLPNLDDL